MLAGDGTLGVVSSYIGSPLLHQHVALLLLSVLLQQAQLIADIIELILECIHLHSYLSL